MVDIKDRRAGRDSLEDSAKAVFHRSVERDKGIEFLRCGGGKADDFVARQIMKFRSGSLFVIGHDFLAAIAQPQGKRDGRPKCVGIGAKMAGDSHSARIAKRIGDGVKVQIHHQVIPP